MKDDNYIMISRKDLREYSAELRIISKGLYKSHPNPSSGENILLSDINIIASELERHSSLLSQKPLG